MDYFEIILRFPKNYSGMDIYLALLSTVGFESFMETEDSLKAYIPYNLLDNSDVDDVLLKYENEFNLPFQKKIIKHTNWNESWETHYLPKIVGDQVIIRAPFHNSNSQYDFEIIIEPKMSFGTAHHETTSLMMELMLREKFQQKRVLDMGCGTGILAIFSELLGADDVVAIDNDMDAFENAKENIKKNNCKHVHVFFGELEQIQDAPFQMVLANINRNTLIDHIDTYCQHLEKNGILLLSGFYAEDLPAIKLQVEKNNLKFCDHLEKNKWVAAKFIYN